MLPGVGIFGTGNLVRIIVPFLKSKGFKIEGIWGRRLTKVEMVAKELDVPYYTNKIDDVLLKKEVHLIFILCSSHIQVQIAVKALSIGKHIICDKPAGLNQSEALRMLHASQYYPTLIALVNHSLRFLPTFIHMKRMIQEGYLGPQSEITVCEVKVQMGPLHLNTYNWLCEETMGGGVVSLVGGHIIDLVMFLISQKAVRVHSIIKTFVETTEHINGIRRITSPDYCTFQMHMSEKTVVNVSINAHMPCMYNQEFFVCGKHGYLIVRGSDLYGFKNGSMKEDIMYRDAEDTKYSSLTVPFKTNIPEPYIKGLFNLIDSLKDAFLPIKDKSSWIKEPVANASTFEDNLCVQAIIEALKKSNQNRRWEYVKLIQDEEVNHTETSSVDLLRSRFTAISL